MGEYLPPVFHRVRYLSRRLVSRMSLDMFCFAEQPCNTSFGDKSPTTSQNSKDGFLELSVEDSARLLGAYWQSFLHRRRDRFVHITRINQCPFEHQNRHRIPRTSWP